MPKEMELAKLVLKWARLDRMVTEGKNTALIDELWDRAKAEMVSAAKAIIDRERALSWFKM